MEFIEEGEEAGFRAYIATEIAKLQGHIPKDSGHDGGQGSKGPDWHHGVTFAMARATLNIDAAKLEALPAELRVGVFEHGGSHPAVVRFNYGTGATCRMSIKLLLGGNAEREINWTAVESFPSFVAKNTQELVILSNNIKKVVAPTHWDMIPTLAKVTKALNKTGNDQEDSALGRQYFSQLPYALGPGAFKYRFTPEEEHPPMVHANGEHALKVGDTVERGSRERWEETDYKKTEETETETGLFTWFRAES